MGAAVVLGVAVLRAEDEVTLALEAKQADLAPAHETKLFVGLNVVRSAHFELRTYLDARSVLGLLSGSLGGGRSFLLGLLHEHVRGGCLEAAHDLGGAGVGLLRADCGGHLVLRLGLLEALRAHVVGLGPAVELLAVGAEAGGGFLFFFGLHFRWVLSYEYELCFLIISDPNKNYLVNQPTA